MPNGQQSITAHSRYLAVIFLQITHERHPIPHLWGRDKVCLCEFTIRPEFYHCYSCDVHTLMFYMTAMIYRESIVPEFVNQYKLIVNWTLGNKLEWRLNQYTRIFMHQDAFQNVVCKMVAILSQTKGSNCNPVYLVFRLSIISSHGDRWLLHSDRTMWTYRIRGNCCIGWGLWDAKKQIMKQLCSISTHRLLLGNVVAVIKVGCAYKM